MGLQLIFVVETNKKSKSDWIYVKDTVDYFYKYERTEVKFSPIYMEGRGKYNSPKKQREIEQKISQYSVTSENNYSKVIYCFDCDKQVLMLYLVSIYVQSVFQTVSFYSLTYVLCIFPVLSVIRA